MPISFPLNPTLNQTYVYNSITWTYNGTSWSKAGASGGTSLPAQATNSGKFLTTDGTAASWSTISVTPTAVSDQSNSSTGYLDLPSGTTLQRPVSPNTGYIRYNTTLGYVEWYDALTTIWRPIYQPPTIPAEYLVVSGGGAGGSDVGGGGGGGQALYGSYPISPGSTISITVGAGGVKGGSAQYGFKGNNSILTLSGTTYTAVGGSGGAGRSAGGVYAGGIGYNGGGGSYDYSATSYSGGNPGATPGSNGGGGGGAGAAGSGVNGGVGVQYATMSANSGANDGYYGGGGGGGAYPSGTGNGGLGGGGNGISGGTGVAGTTSTGGGGGGGGSAAGANGSNGGSGVVVLRYADSYPAATTTTGSPTITVSSGYRTYTFTASGSITF